MASIHGILRAAAGQLHADYRRREGITFGIYWGYPFILQAGSISDRHSNIRIYLSVDRNLSAFQPLLPKNWDMQRVDHLHRIIMPVRGSTRSQAKVLLDFLERFLIALEGNGVKACDGYGGMGEIGIYRVKGELAFLTEENAERVENTLDMEKAENAAIPESISGGILGALIAGIPASLLVLVIARAGYVTSLSSALFGVAIAYGYKWKGKQISGISWVICLLLGVILGYTTFRIDLALDLHKVLPELSVVSAFFHGRTLLEMAGGLDDYYANFAMLFGFGMLCLIVSLVILQKEKKRQFECKKII